MDEKPIYLEKEGISCNLEKNIDEIIQNYCKRWWFISNLKPKTKNEYDDLIRLSNIWINMITLKCKYVESIEKKILNIVKSFETSNNLKIKLV